jgi:hypothetical protein
MNVTVIIHVRNDGGFESDKKLLEGSDSEDLLIKCEE